MNLTRKENEVLRYLCEGMTSGEIAPHLKISERTVNFHIANLISKLAAKNRMHAVAIAIFNHLVDFPEDAVLRKSVGQN